jgi:hypothetical protein
MQFCEEIDETWKGGFEAFETAFEKSPGTAFCRMLDRVARKRGWESVRRCAGAYWDRLSEVEKRNIGLDFCEKSYERGATINAVTQIVLGG